MFSFTPQEVQERFLSAEQLMRACDQVWSADSKANVALERGQPRAASSIYCKVDHLVGLFDCLRKVRDRVVLVSSESDRPITDEFFHRCPPQIAHWFSTNLATRNDRLSVLPLGLANSYCDITLKAPSIAAEARAFQGRPDWLYVNFRTTTNPSVREPVMQHFRALAKENWVTVQEPQLGFEEYLTEMTSHRFVLCPPGNGTDTHRLWEALYSRTIPVTMETPAMQAFHDLPILFVDDFRRLTQAFLATEYERICATNWNWPKLFLPWWRARIAQQCESLRKPGAGLLRRSEFLREITETRLEDLKRRVLRRV